MHTYRKGNQPDITATSQGRHIRICYLITGMDEMLHEAPHEQEAFFHLIFYRKTKVDPKNRTVC